MHPPTNILVKKDNNIDKISYLTIYFIEYKKGNINLFRYKKYFNVKEQ